MTAFEISSFGYWISPEGQTIPLRKLQSHAEVILDQGVCDGEFSREKSEVAERAVASGWLAVSIAPVGQSISVRVRDASIDIRAAKAFQSLAEMSGWLDLPIYTEHQCGAGRELAKALTTGSFDSRKYESYEDQVKHLKATLLDLHLSRAQLLGLRNFLSAPTGIDTQEVFVRLRQARKACDEAIQMIKTYSFRNITRSDTALAYAADLNSSFLDQQRLIDERLVLAKDAFFGNFELANFGDPLATYVGLSAEVAVRDLHLAISTLKDAVSSVRREVKELGSGKKALDFLDRVVLTRASLGLVKHHMKRFSDDLTKRSLTTEEVVKITQFYVAHECARTYFANRWRPFEEMQEALLDFSGTVVKCEPVFGM